MILIIIRECWLGLNTYLIDHSANAMLTCILVADMMFLQEILFSTASEISRMGDRILHKGRKRK
jgi:hypothetical protein